MNLTLKQKWWVKVKYTALQIFAFPRLRYINYSLLTSSHYQYQCSALLSRQPNTQAQTRTKTHTLTHNFTLPSGPRLQHVTEKKQLFSTGPVGWLSARLLMTSIWGNHRFPVALIKSRLIKTFAIHPVLTLQVVFFPLSLSFHSTLIVVYLFSCWDECSCVCGETDHREWWGYCDPPPSPITHLQSKTAKPHPG